MPTKEQMSKIWAYNFDKYMEKVNQNSEPRELTIEEKAIAHRKEVRGYCSTSQDEDNVENSFLAGAKAQKELSDKEFIQSIELLRDLADLQNGAPLEQHRKEWEETMDKVYSFLNKWEV